MSAIAYGLTAAAVPSRASRRPRGREKRPEVADQVEPGRVKQGELFGSVASDPTLWRALSEIGPQQREQVAAARARTRRRTPARSL